jgi:fluoroacetyl-CoA thioesterase
VAQPVAGLMATLVHTVTDADTAIAVGSGDVPVLGTPRLVALAEAATVRAVADGLAPGETSVGTRVAVEHLRPSAVGATVTLTAELVAVAGSRLSFRVRAEQSEAGRSHVVASGEIDRVVVDRQRFLTRVPRP